MSNVLDDRGCWTTEGMTIKQSLPLGTPACMVQVKTAVKGMPAPVPKQPAAITDGQNLWGGLVFPKARSFLELKCTSGCLSRAHLTLGVVALHSLLQTLLHPPTFPGSRLLPGQVTLSHSINSTNHLLTRW